MPEVGTIEYEIIPDNGEYIVKSKVLASGWFKDSPPRWVYNYVATCYSEEECLELIKRITDA